MSGALDIVMLSHLNWDRRLFQRPQQLATRFARMGHRVAYFSVERLVRFAQLPIPERIQEPEPNLLAVMLPQVPGAWRFDWARRMTDASVAARARHAWTTGRRVLWCQHPRFARIAGELKPEVLVYDAMDPHGAFARRDESVVRMEDELLAAADVVFAGGRSLAGLLESRGAKPICLPSGIDFAHFAAAADPGPVHPASEHISRPILGYFGAIDERIDWDLLAWIARERRNWSIVLVGPVLGDASRFPSEQNLHLAGACEYRDLPQWLRAFDVCLIPWVVNDLTRYMSPTKTPEYLASGRPVVSSAIPDVEADYAQDVQIARTQGEWLESCTRALMRGSGAPVRPAASLEWDEIARRMVAAFPVVQA